MSTQKKAPSKKSKTANLTGTGGGWPDGPNGRFWTQWIRPKGAALLSQMLGPVYFVVKNHGANNVMLVAHHGDLIELPAGAVRATYARGTITVENKGEKPALIEFEFMPIHLKP
jgi:hypothetical protein